MFLFCQVIETYLSLSNEKREKKEDKVQISLSSTYSTVQCYHAVFFIEIHVNVMYLNKHTFFMFFFFSLRIFIFSPPPNFHLILLHDVITLLPLSLLYLIQLLLQFLFSLVLKTFSALEISQSHSTHILIFLPFSSPFILLLPLLTTPLNSCHTTQCNKVQIIQKKLKIR
jgi:hypothetical protein